MKITIRLRPGRDNDIKDWYEALPHGDRSTIIRNIIKEFINHRESINPDHVVNTANISLGNRESEVDLSSAPSSDYKAEDIDNKIDNLLEQI